MGQLNNRLADRRFALMGPGRWGSNDSNLGVQVSYADINRTRLLVEVAFARDGYTPEVSYGTHFFQDLVEADIAIVPLYPDSPGSMLREEVLLQSANALAGLAPELTGLENVIHVLHVPSARQGELLHVYLDSATQEGVGAFGPPVGQP